MKERGRVVRAGESIAEVIISRSPSCDRCRACAIFDDGNVVTEAIDPIGVEIGDEVEIEIDEKSILKAVSIVYLFPVLMLFFGYWLGHALFDGQEYLSMITGFVLAVGSLFSVRVIESRLFKDTSTKPVRIRKRY